jgi:epoxyqueuosine reductase
MHATNATRDSVTALVKLEAKRQAFDYCGVAAAGPIDAEDRLGTWLERGYDAGMDWIGRARATRQDIRKRLPGARSVVVVAKNYYHPRPKPPEGGGRVSRYAWGRDYHNVMRKPIGRLATFIASLETGAQTFCSVDAGPVLERAWAAQAGIGWVGRNSLVLREGVGSYFFLGVVATTVGLTPDTPVPDRCGSCRACVKACPTEAIVEGRMVDSRRCISYHTIENRGAIPAELGRDFGDWVFGCDVCQEVCPWNRKAPVSEERDFRPRRDHAHPRLDKLVAITEEAFRREFEGTPIMRAKPDGIRRNAAIVLANRHEVDSDKGQP